jgi:5-methyltetrahydropteroyltriglutamate--homocysteine methyltransferase
MSASPTPEPARAEVVGSLLRPAYLKEARDRFEAGGMAAAEFKRIEDRAVDEAIHLQQEAGLDVVTDGELRRFSFLGPLTEAVHGIGPTKALGVPTRWHGDEGDRELDYEWPMGVVGKVNLRRSLVGEEFAYARGKTAKQLKVTMPSPLMMTNVWHPEASRAVYEDVFELCRDASAILRREVEHLVELGCTYIQIDAPEFAKLVDEEGRRWHAALGATPERMLAEGIELLNGIPAGIDGVTFGVHLCRGNNQGLWRSAGGYEAITEFFRRATAFDVFLLEYDDERSGTFEPLAEVPEDKRVVLGLVTTKRPQLEDPDKLLERIEDAARCVPLERLAVSTQCGFASDIVGNPLSQDDERAKLSLVSTVARRVWG